MAAVCLEYIYYFLLIAILMQFFLYRMILYFKETGNKTRDSEYSFSTSISLGVKLDKFLVYLHVAVIPCMFLLLRGRFIFFMLAAVHVFFPVFVNLYFILLLRLIFTRSGYLKNPQKEKKIGKPKVMKENVYTL